MLMAARTSPLNSHENNTPRIVAPNARISSAAREVSLGTLAVIWSKEVGGEFRRDMTRYGPHPNQSPHAADRENEGWGFS